jgi:RND family efflux transporter MFP subunit
MTRFTSRGIRWAGVGLVAVALTSAGVWTFRSAIARWPVVGRLVPAAPEELWTCTMHPHVREHGPGPCPICGMPLVPVESETAGTPATPPPAPPMDMAGSDSGMQQAPDPRAPVTIDARRQQLIGVRTVAAERSPLARTVRTVGVVRYDETRLTDVNLRLDGWIDELFVDSTGKLVKAGEPLFTLYSPELVATQNEYLLARRSRDELGASEIADARAYADRLVEAARRRLELWDLPADQVAELERTGEPRTHIVFRSPASGYVVEKMPMRGQHIAAGQSLYRLADLSVVWVEADLYERDLAFVRVGDRAIVTLDAYPGEHVSGRLVYIYPFADEPARTVRARFALENPRARLRPGMYAGVELESTLGTGLTVPTDAVLDSGRDQFVFLAEGNGHFQPRQVETGFRLDSRIEIRAGLKEGDVVATGAAFFIDSESQLRAAIPGFEAPPPIDDTTTDTAALRIELVTQPDPPRAGDNTFEVAVSDATGAPVADATVSVVLFMPAMPSMNMPAMRTQATLLADGGGRYRGRVEVNMSGRWDVTITVTRDGRTIGRVERAIVAR